MVWLGFVKIVLSGGVGPLCGLVSVRCGLGLCGVCVVLVGFLAAVVLGSFFTLLVMLSVFSSCVEVGCFASTFP